MVLLALAGCAMIVNNSINNTLLQTAAPDHLRGRIMGFYSFVFVGMAPFGAFFFGLVAEHVGVPATIAAGGAVVALAVTIAGGGVAGIRNAGCRGTTSRALPTPAFFLPDHQNSRPLEP